MMPVDIPVDADPIERLERVTDRTTTLKRLNMAHGIDLVTQLFQNIPAMGQSLAINTVMTLNRGRLAERAAMPPVAHLVCTNVPGPPVPLYAAGHKVLSHVPLLPVVPGMGLSMGVFSYAGTIHFGFIADTKAAPDVNRFAAFIDEAFAELYAAAVKPVDEERIDEVATKRAERTRKPAARTSSKPKIVRQVKPVQTPLSAPQRRRSMAASPS
jgi:hypothetical protein